MPNRRELKDLHEASVLRSFEQFLIGKGCLFQLISRPDPPDAIAKINGVECWIEITDTFFSESVAISITSYAADDIPHRPSSGQKVFDPEMTVVDNIATVIEKKLVKPTLRGKANSSGPGILLVGLFGPFVDIAELVDNLPAELTSLIANQNMFSSVYIYEADSAKGHIYRAIS